MIEFFLRRSAFTNLCTLILLGVGAYNFATVKREAFPDIRFDIVTITTVYPGASSEEVERLVTNPIEDMIRGTDHVDRVESYSTADISVIILRLDENLSDRQVDRTINDVQQAVARVRDLPREIDRPVVTELSSDRPLIALSVAGGELDARDRMAEELAEALEDLPGVSRVTYEGRPPREIWVEADPSRLAARDLTLGELAASIAGRNVSLTAGTVVSDGGEVQVRALGGLDTAADVADVILRSNDRRNQIRVRDVASVRETFEDDKMEFRMGGEPAITLRVNKRRSADAISLAVRVREVKARYEPLLAEKGMTVTESDDISFFIKRRLNVMKNNMAMGAFFIVAAMLLFLDWRLAVVASVGIPVALATSFAVGISLGVTLNLLTVMAFIIVLGMLNDDAIVVADNIYRHLQMGKDRFQAAVDGTKEVVKPVLGAILTSCAAFLPFALVTGIMGKFMIVFPIIIVLCLASSLFEAFFILPAHALDASRFGRPVRHTADHRWYVLVVDRYRIALGWALVNKWKFLASLTACVLGIGGLAFARLEVVMFPPGLIEQFFLQVEMEPGTPLGRTGVAMRRIENAVLKLSKDELEAVSSTVGLTGFEETVRRGTHLAQARVFLTPQDGRERTTEEIIETLRDDIGRIPGARRFTVERLRPGPPVGKAVMVRIRGNDTEVLRALADRYKDRLAATPGVRDIRDSFEEGKSQLIVRPRHAELAFAGLDATGLARHLLTAFHGLETTKIRRAKEEVAVRVKLAGDAQAPDVLNRLFVTNVQGRPVPMKRLIRFERDKGEEYISHYNFRRTITITADVDNVKATSFAVNADLKSRFASLASDHPGYEAIYGGEEEQTQESFRSLGRAFLVALLLNVAILMAIFESWTQPFLIALTIPIGLVGVLCALLLHGQPMSFMALLGAVAMTGVVVNNSIVLVDFVNRLRARSNIPVRKALIEAGSVRLRPIFASSVTTLLCLFPTAYGWGGEEPFVQPIALSMAWGLTFAMPLTLFVIPIAYVIADDVQSWVTRRFSRKPPGRTRASRVG